MNTVHSNEDFSWEQKLGIVLIAGPLLGAIPVGARHQEVRLDVEQRATKLLSRQEGIQISDRRFLDTNVLNTRVRMIVPGGVYIYDKMTHTLIPEDNISK